MNRWAISTLVFLLAVPSYAAPRRRAITPAPAPVPSPCAHSVLAVPYTSNDVTVDDSFAYFADDKGGLFRVPKSGGSVATLARLTDETTIDLIVLDGNTVYFAASDDTGLHGTIYSVPKAGGTPAGLVTGVITPYDMVVDAQNLYWTSFGTPTATGDIQADGKVERASKSGANRMALVTGVSGPTALVVDDTNVYYVETGIGIGNSAMGVRAVPKNGGAVRSVVDHVPAVALTANATVITYSTYDSDLDAGTIARVAKSGGMPALILTEKGVVGLTLRIVGDRLYSYGLSTVSETLRSLSLTTGELKEIINQPLDTTRFALDDCAIYYVTFDDTVERTPR